MSEARAAEIVSLRRRLRKVDIRQMVLREHTSTCHEVRNGMREKGGRSRSLRPGGSA